MGLTVWLTGLPSSGKSTLARLVAQGLARGGRPAVVFDGDELRETVCADLGFSRADREEQTRRAGALAIAAVCRDAVAIVALISPFEAAREKVRVRHHEAGIPFIEVFVGAPMWVCAERDAKGLYAAQRNGRLHGLTGVDDPYEAPAMPDLVVHTESQEPAESAGAILSVVTRTLEHGSEARTEFLF